MASVPRHRLTPEQYLALDRAADRRSEFYDGAMFAMGGASYRHVVIVGNLSDELNSRLRGGPCRALTSELRTSIGNGNYVYPDVLVVCSKPQFLDGQFDTVANPQIVIEVLSPSTERWDRGGKFRDYQQVASLRQYLLIEQDAPGGTWFDRQADGSWRGSSFEGLDGSVPLESLGLALTVRAIYRDVF